MCAEGSGKQKSPYCSWIAFGSRGGGSAVGGLVP